MQFDYEEALVTLNVSEKDVSELREKIKKFKHVPETFSDKKVGQVNYP
jgi:hypothetical protein